jgi:hypothetical protein
MSQYASYYAGTQYDPVDMMMRDADWFNPGVVSASDLLVTQTATASMNVLVTGAAKGSIGGNAWLPNGYRFLNDAQATLSIAAADTTNPRIDLIVACVDTTTTPYTPGLKVVKGTAAVSPAVPSITSGLVAIPLYRVYVAANATTITNSNLTDVRAIASISAIDISLTDSGNYFTGTNTEAALQEVGASLAEKMNKGTSSTNLNTMTDAGSYRLTSGLTNAPSGVDYGQLLVLHGADDTVAQIIFDYASNVAYKRVGNPINTTSGSWTAWQRILDQRDYDDITTLQTAGGTATAITLTGVTLSNGFSKTFIASANNNAVATTINGKPLYKPGTTTAPKLIAGKAYTVWYNTTSTCFFIKASAEGTVTADKVLAGYTFSNDDDTGLTGTMISRAYAENAVGSWTDGLGKLSLKMPTGAYITEGGFGAGYTAPTITDANFIAANILTGVSIFGIAGTAKKVAIGTGTISQNDSSVKTINIGFTPTKVFVTLGGGSGGRGSVFHARSSSSDLYSDTSTTSYIKQLQGSLNTSYENVTIVSNGFTIQSYNDWSSSNYKYWAILE